MRQIRIVKNWQWPDLMQQTPGYTGMWGEVQFTEKPVEKCDYLIILNNLEINLELKCPPSHIWRVVQEPPIEFFKSWHVNPSYSLKTFTCDPELSGPGYIPSHPMLPWHINRDYDFLVSTGLPEKTKMLSWITSTKNVLNGQKKRMNFLSFISNKIDELDLLGGGIYHLTKPVSKKRNEEKQRELGFKTIEDKWAGLAPYKYSLAIENHSGPDYWTEKIADCFLSWTVPIYYGCTNLEDYFPEDSFIRIDINKPDEALSTINRIIREDSWEERLSALKKARNLVLNKYQLFPYMSNYINSLSFKDLPDESEKIWLRPSEIGGKALNRKTNPKISVVVCTYNRDQMLPECLESLSNQRVDKNLYEVIVVDNNSKDNTQEVANGFVRKYSNFRYLFEPEQGLSHARNLGLKTAAADYIAYIDDDARVKEGWLEKALKIIDEKKPDIFGGPVYPIFPSGKPEWFKEKYGTRGYMGETGWLKKGYIIGTNIFFKKSLLEEYGGFDPELGMKGEELAFHEETKLAFRAFEENKKVYYSNEIAVYDIVPQYKSSLIYFLLSFYRKGFTSLLLKEKENNNNEFFKLPNLIDDMMNELNSSLFKRNLKKHKYPENYLFEKLSKKLMKIGRLVRILLRNEKMIKRRLKNSNIEEYENHFLKNVIKKRNVFLLIKDILVIKFKLKK